MSMQGMQSPEGTHRSHFDQLREMTSTARTRNIHSLMVMSKSLSIGIFLTGSDDLPVIKENIRKGFVETQNKFNSWITDIKKRLDGDSPENSPPSLYERPTTRPLDQPSTRNSRDVGYDADPRVISDDFTHLHLRDNSIMDGRTLDSRNPIQSY